MIYKKNKYYAQKIEVDGIVFDSKKECRRYFQLLMMEQAGEISDIRRQVKYTLIPAQREPDTIGPKGGIKKGKLLERECAYIADFVYKTKAGTDLVEDTKGFRTADYKIKRKLMLWVHGIRIHEI